MVARTRAIECRGLTKTYGRGATGVRALRGVDLEARKGEILLVVGPSGSGKTTLISIVSTVLDQDDGECEVLGHDVHGMSQRDRAQLRGRSIGFVFQTFNLLPALTVTENAAVPLLVQGESRKRAFDVAAHALDSVGLGDRLDAMPAQLSGGQQQRVAIARAIVHRPELIVCDEPTSNLDHATGQQVMQLIRDLVRQHDRCVVIVTHDARILPFADRVARMDDGRVVGIGAPAAGDSL